MDEMLSALTSAVRLANLVLAGYLLSFMVPLYRRERHESFSRTMHLMVIAVSLFFVVEAIQVFRLVPAEAFEPVQAFFTFVFLLMLIAAMLEVKKNLRVHDHIMRRKGREKLRDVD